MTLFAAIETRWLKLPPNVRGILWLVMGTLAFSINDLFVKSLGKSMSPFQMAFFRYGIGFLIMAPVFLRMGAVGLKTSRPGIHGARLSHRMHCAGWGLHDRRLPAARRCNGAGVLAHPVHHDRCGDCFARSRQRWALDCDFRRIRRRDHHGATRR